jgi:mannose-1-phosphate guanylyltransferase
MVADGSLFAFDGDTYWIDAGSPATYLRANLDLVTGVRSPKEPGLHPDAEVDGAVTTSVVGAQATVGDGAIVAGSVVLSGAVVGPGALVKDAIIGPGARVGDGAVVDDGAVLGDGVEVPTGDEVHGMRIPEES